MLQGYCSSYNLQNMLGVVDYAHKRLQESQESNPSPVLEQGALTSYRPRQPLANSFSLFCSFLCALSATIVGILTHSAHICVHVILLCSGIFIADALSMPVHWYYSVTDLKRDFGEITDYQVSSGHVLAAACSM